MDDRKNRVLMAAAGLLLAGVALFALFPAFRENGERMKQVKPMLEEADRLALDYNKVLSGGEEYVGKYVLWCVQNRSEDEVLYKGDMRARLKISNYRFMPIFRGSKHASCSDMLLNIEDVRKTSSGSGMITAEFIYSRE